MKNSYFAACILALVLGACQPSGVVTLKEPQFGGPAFNFAVGSVDLKKSAAPVAGDIQDKYSFPTRIDGGVEKWSHQRLRAAGGPNRLEVDIKEAYVTEEPLAVDKGFSGMFKDEQSRRYTAHLKLALNLYSGDRYMPRAGVESQAHRNITLPESASAAQREEAFNNMVIALLQQIDVDLSQRIPQYFQPYMAY